MVKKNQYYWFRKYRFKLRSEYSIYNDTCRSLFKNKNVKFICGIDKSINQEKFLTKDIKYLQPKLNDIALLKSNFIV